MSATILQFRRKPMGSDIDVSRPGHRGAVCIRFPTESFQEDIGHDSFHNGFDRLPPAA